MADISLKSTNASTQTGNNSRSLDVEVSYEQLTYPAAVAMGEGSVVYIDSNGKFALADASAAGAAARPYGITTRKVAAGEAVTAVAKGVLGGFDFASQGYGAEIFLSDTDSGKLADAAGTVSVKVGTVIPKYGVPRGTALPKLLRVNL
jgi:hypothetical protein